MASGTNSLTIGGAYDNTNRVAKFTTVSYDPSWMFDSTIELSVCSDYGAANSIGYTVQNLKVKYAALPLALSIINFSNTGLNLTFLSYNIFLVTMIADDKLDDGNGKNLKNSQGTLGSATLSMSPPNWNSDGGMTFTASNQYIELPNFIPSASDLAITTSVTFAFYIKIDTAPSVTTNVMSYYCTSVKYLKWQSMKIFLFLDSRCCFLCSNHSKRTIHNFSRRCNFERNHQFLSRKMDYGHCNILLYFWRLWCIKHLHRQ